MPRNESAYPAGPFDPRDESTWPKFLSPEQLAAILNVPIGTVYDWSSRGLLNDVSFKFGRHLRIDRDAFLKKYRERSLR